MKFTIDTTSKTIIIEQALSIQEVTDFFKKILTEDEFATYSIVSKDYSNIYTQYPWYVNLYPYSAQITTDNVGS